jgi:hypothetical protein
MKEQKKLTSLRAAHGVVFFTSMRSLVRREKDETRLSEDQLRTIAVSSLIRLNAPCAIKKCPMSEKNSVENRHNLVRR